MKRELIMVVMLLALAFSVSASPPRVGAIWTTNSDCGADTQDENHYDIGSPVYIHGKNFAEGFYNWSIIGQPGKASCDPAFIVADGDVIVDKTGEFCFLAYNISDDDCGEYKASVGTKHDDYQVNKELAVPEFSTVAAGLALLGTGIFISRRRK